MLRSLVNLDVKADPRDIEESLFCTLKLSYDNLADDNLRQCFLCCAQWPEDSFIRTVDLIEYWIGIGLIDDFRNIGESFDKGYNLIGNLNAACLLELESRSDDDYVKLHDVIRDMALWIVSEYGKKKNKWSICTNDDDDISQYLVWKAVKCHNSFPNIFPHIPSLIYLNLSWEPISDLSKEIRVIVNLRYLNISYTYISSLPSELKELKELKYFIFRGGRMGTSIKDGLSTLSKLPNLQVLDLYENNCLKADDLSLLNRRRILKAIGMHVTSVKTLGLLKDLPTWNISMQGLHRMPLLRFCDLSYKHGGEGLMRTLEVEGCSAIKELIDPAEMQQASSGLSTFPRLQYLKIRQMPNLVSLCTCPLDFPVLSKLQLELCPKLKKLPFKSSIVNNKFEHVTVDEDLWESLEWEDTTIGSHLTKFLVTLGFMKID
ncbi:disease resistance protein RPS2-like [Dioscorea cayenensis subsp. rotundata]|uniref:Disease resistance protein RPS2-like n=1 Tax=Dioscorea cayennensis subsp. rotundata TaxID=55577 RepID=A0AB40B182_DIOCR|nr:disease resistance protein RPS2-like [Dioscorea cayenensis subsp. rotundata]